MFLNTIIENEINNIEQKIITQNMTLEQKIKAVHDYIINQTVYDSIGAKNLNNEDSYILSIKSYMDNDSILDRIKNESEFKNITLLYKAEDGSNSNVVMDNLYLVSK